MRTDFPKKRISWALLWLWVREVSVQRPTRRVLADSFSYADLSLIAEPASDHFPLVEDSLSASPMLPRTLSGHEVVEAVKYSIDSMMACTSIPCFRSRN